MGCKNRKRGEKQCQSIEKNQLLLKGNNGTRMATTQRIVVKSLTLGVGHSRERERLLDTTVDQNAMERKNVCIVGI